MDQFPGESAQTSRPPVLLGCLSAVAVAVLAFGFVAFLIVFLESGADTGKVRLEHAETYQRGTVQFIGAENLYLVRLMDGSFVALDDLDAANRARPERRCRVAILPASDERLPGIIGEYGAGMSPAAKGSALVFREDCGGAIYDVTGLRLDAGERNLDRYPVTIDAAGNVVVDTARRECSQRDGAELFAEASCE